MATTIIKQPRATETIKQIFITCSVTESLGFIDFVGIVLQTYMINGPNTIVALYIRGIIVGVSLRGHPNVSVINRSR